MAVSRIKVVLGIVGLIIGFVLVIVSSIMQGYYLGTCVGQLVDFGSPIGSTMEYFLYITFTILIAISVALASFGIVLLSTSKRAY